MNDRKLGYAIIGLFLIMFCMAFAYLLQPILHPPHSCAIVFKQVGNLRIEDQVRVQGVVAGTVKKISLKNNQVVVNVQTREKLSLHSGFSIVTMDAGIMGDRMIMIDCGDSARPLYNADTFPGEFYPGVSEALNHVGRLQEIIDSIKQMSASLLHGTARKPSLVSQANAMVKEIDALSKKYQRIAQTANGSISSAIDTVDLIVHQTALLSNAVAVSAPEYIDMLNRKMESINKLLLTIDTVTGKLQSFEKTLKNPKNILWRNDAVEFKNALQKLHESIDAIRLELPEVNSYIHLY